MTSHDEWYNKWMSSSLLNACVVRVTNQCDQQCRHCVFRSEPNQIGQLSVETCEKINAWTPKKVVLNIMGGEFSVLDNYPEILVALTRDRPHVRLVTNGFWAGHGTEKFFDAMYRIKDAACCEIDVVVSQDRWHKTNGSLAIKLLENFSPIINIVRGGLEQEDVIPIGRAWDNNLVQRNAAWCSCESMCSMIISEDGVLGRCPFGYFPWKHFSETTWNDAQEYIWGWRSEKLAEEMNCHLCMEIVKAAHCERFDLCNS